MATYRLLNEFGLSSVVLALEPASKCVAGCTYCFAELNKRSQWGNKERRDEDPGSFERLYERALGPDYDPTDIRQWGLRHRLPLGWANTVEPFQDLPQAEAILRLLDRAGVPLFVQTKGVNFPAIWPTLRNFADNAVLFVSFPTDDDRVIKRFEPGTPKSAARWAMIETAAAAGMQVTLALAPYHEDWCADPAAFVRRAADAGVSRIFFDRLHLKDRQATNCKDPVTVALAQPPADGGTKLLDHIAAIHEAALDAGLGISASGGEWRRMGLLSTETSLVPVGAIRRPGAGHWPYFDRAFLLDLDYLDLADPGGGPVLVTWDDARDGMERHGGIDQPFSLKSLKELRCVRDLAPGALRALGSHATPAEVFRAMWNDPRGAFAWRHPNLRVALRPDGTAWTDAAGNAVGVYDGAEDWRGRAVKLDSLDAIPRVEWADEDDDDADAPA